MESLCVLTIEMKHTVYVLVTTTTHRRNLMSGSDYSLIYANNIQKGGKSDP